MTKKRVLVLGANGFIGSQLVDRLSREDYHIRAFGRFNNGINFLESPNVEIFDGDFLNQNDIELALKDVSVVIHLVSTTNPAVSDKDPLIDLTTNVEGSVNLFQKCAENGGIKKIIFASSGGTVYGDDYPKRPFIETDQTKPVSPYGIGKVTIENYLRYFKKKYNQDYLVLRIANPYGGRQKNTRHQGIIPVIIDSVHASRPITIYGDGSMVRDYIYIDDLIDVITRTLDKKMKFETYNVGSGVGVSINQLIEEAEKVIGKKAIIEYLEQPATFVHTSILDNSRINKELINLQKTKLSDGLSNTYSNYLRHI
ncbi:NAD-dependent epimerase/dehydratase family protein [Candidatus Saccharibacteria bacterium]|nr:NAD-dependent epimerase/dehydratase family protein [Candidatus Saccharibacteria bacterium]